MALSTTTGKVVYTGSGITGPFTFSFPIYAATDLIVTKYTIADGTEEVLVLTTDYTVAGSFTSTEPDDGSVTLVSALSASYKLIIERSLAFTQPVDLQPNDNLPANTIEKSMADRIVMLIQQVKDISDRALTADISNTTGYTLPIPSADLYLGWNSAADDLENKAAPTATDYPGSISAGLDASKSASPAQKDIYVATDTGKLYIAFAAATWTYYAPIVDLSVTTAKLAVGVLNGLSTVTAVSTDYVAIADASDSGNAKKALVSDILSLATGGGVLGSYKNLSVVRDSVTQVTVTADELILEDSSNNKAIIRSVSEAIAITTSGASGLDTGSEGSSRWYYIWIIRKSSDGTTNGLLSESSSAPTMPSGYDQKALVSAVRNDGSSDFIDFKQVGNEWHYVAWQTMDSGAKTITVWTSVTTSTFIPSALSTFLYGAIRPHTNSIVSNENSSTADITTYQANKYMTRTHGLDSQFPFDLPIHTADTMWWSNDGGSSSVLFCRGFKINKIG